MVVMEALAKIGMKLIRPCASYKEPQWVSSLTKQLSCAVEIDKPQNLVV